MGASLPDWLKSETNSLMICCSIPKCIFRPNKSQSCSRTIYEMFAKDITLDEALESIKGAPEFKVVQSRGYTFIKYNK